MLANTPEVEIVGEADNGIEAVRLCRDLSPDVVIMDVTMPDLNGIEAARQVSAECPQTKVLALSMHSNRRFVIDMLKSGASGYLLKDCAFEELALALKTVCSNRPYISPSVGWAVVEKALSPQNAVPSALQALTPREREVLQLLAEGRKAKEVAARLHVSEKTVQTHRRNIMDKLNLRTLPHLTKFAIAHGLTSLET